MFSTKKSTITELVLVLQHHYGHLLAHRRRLLLHRNHQRDQLKHGIYFLLYLIYKKGTPNETVLKIIQDQNMRVNETNINKYSVYNIHYLYTLTLIYNTIII